MGYRRNKMKKIYILLTDTGTVFTRCIKLFTRKKYNHSSIALDSQLKAVYSFGRKNVSNPFDGGFVHENLYHNFFLRAKCQVFQIEVTEEQYELLKQNVLAFDLDKNRYKYNLIGVIGVALHQRWERENAYFCSQFLAHVLEESGLALFDKPSYLITPGDLIDALNPQLVYEGRVDDYLVNSQSYIEQPVSVYEEIPTSTRTSLLEKLGLPVLSRFF